MDEEKARDLLQNTEKLHTTDSGTARIRQNLSLDTRDVVSWCKEKIQEPDAVIDRSGKNWYVYTGDCTITINAHSYTIITAHKGRKTRQGESGTAESGSQKGKSEECRKRLEAFEKMLAGIQEQYEDTRQKMEQMKTEGKTKSATYRQLMGTKMTYQNMLSMYQIYGLLEDTAK